MKTRTLFIALAVVVVITLVAIFNKLGDDSLEDQKNSGRPPNPAGKFVSSTPNSNLPLRKISEKGINYEIYGRDRSRHLLERHFGELAKQFQVGEYYKEIAPYESATVNCFSIVFRGTSISEFLDEVSPVLRSQPFKIIIKKKDGVSPKEVAGFLRSAPEVLRKRITDTSTYTRIEFYPRFFLFVDEQTNQGFIVKTLDGD